MSFVWSCLLGQEFLESRHRQLPPLRHRKLKHIVRMKHIVRPPTASSCLSSLLTNDDL